MEVNIKQLKQNSQIIFPQTVSEAVLVKDSNSEITTLDKILDKKIENIITPLNSGLRAIPQESSNIILTHANQILANDNLAPYSIKYDSNGHIVETSPMGKIIVSVNKKGYFEYDGVQDKSMLLGDDFNVDENNNIILKWNNL